MLTVGAARGSLPSLQRPHLLCSTSGSVHKMTVVLTNCKAELLHILKAANQTSILPQHSRALVEPEQFSSGCSRSSFPSSLLAETWGPQSRRNRPWVFAPRVPRPAGPACWEAWAFWALLLEIPSTSQPSASSPLTELIIQFSLAKSFQVKLPPKAIGAILSCQAAAPQGTSLALQRYSLRHFPADDWIQTAICRPAVAEN